MKRILLVSIIVLHGMPALGQDEPVLIPPEATALLAVDPITAPSSISAAARRLDLENLSQAPVPSATAMIPDGGGQLAIQGAASIGFIGRSDWDSGLPVLVGMERADGSRIVVTSAESLTAFEVPMSESDFKVVASVKRGAGIFALVDVYIGTDDVESSLRRIREGVVQTLLVFKTGDRPLDMTYFPNGDLAVVVRTDGANPLQHPKVLRISEDGKIIWKNRYSTSLSVGSEPIARGIVHGAGGDAVLIVGTVGSSPWIMKLNGDGQPVWEKSYLNGSIGGEFNDGASGPGGFSLAGLARMGRDSPEALIAKVSPDGELVWMRGCGGLAYDEATSATFTSDGGLLITGATKSKERATRSDFETDTWIMSFDKDGWLAWETTLGLGGAAVAAWESDVAYAATDRRTVGSFALRPAVGSGDWDWQVPQVYPFVPKNIGTPSALSEGAATCFDIIAQLKMVLEATTDPDFAGTLRDLRLRRN